MPTIEIEAAHIFWLIAGSVIPVILFWKRLHFMTKKNLDMHMTPEDHGFGTRRTNQLLSQHMDDEREQHRENMTATRSLQHTIRELTHYVRWSATERSGKKPPPFIDESEI